MAKHDNTSVFETETLPISSLSECLEGLPDITTSARPARTFLRYPPFCLDGTVEGGLELVEALTSLRPANAAGNVQSPDVGGAPR